MRSSGFVTLVGRPNVGKSSLVNAICGDKVSIVSDKPQTTRHRVRGVLTRPDAQLVFVDTPGLHKPVTALGRKVNATAIESVAESDSRRRRGLPGARRHGAVRDGDRWVAGHLDLPSHASSSSTRSTWHPPAGARPAGGGRRARRGGLLPGLGAHGDGLDALVEHLVARLPEGPAFFPDETVRDVPDEQWVAELVREQLLAVTRDELPYSIATASASGRATASPSRSSSSGRARRGWSSASGGERAQAGGERARRQLPGGHVPRPAGQGRQGLAGAGPDRVERLG